jgi:hypothetical protein
MPASSESLIDRSQTCSASMTSEFGAGAPVLRSQRRRTVRIISASTNSAITSWSSGKSGVDRPHLGGVGVIPLLEFLRRHAMRFLETVGKRLINRRSTGLALGGVGARKLDMLEAAPGRAVGLGVAMFLPGQIVEGPGGVSDAPMHHGASGIAFQRLLEST